MELHLLLALLALVVVLVPVLQDPRLIFANPAAYFFLALLWGGLFKGLYIAVLRQEPFTEEALAGRNDRIFINADGVEALLPGYWLLLLAAVAYALAFVILCRIQKSEYTDFRSRAALRFTHSKRVIWWVCAAVSASLISLAIYFLTSNVDLSETGLSAKRFLPTSTGNKHYLSYYPYYFFKLSLMLAPLSVLTFAYFTVHRDSNDSGKLFAVFLTAFALAVMVSFYASLRLPILVLLLQLFLISKFLQDRWWTKGTIATVPIIVICFVMMTFVVRPSGYLAERAGTNFEEMDSNFSTKMDGDFNTKMDGDFNNLSTKKRRRHQLPIAGCPAAASRSAALKKAPAGDAQSPSQSNSEATSEDVWPKLICKVSRKAFIAFEGRYFLDATKLAHIYTGMQNDVPLVWGASFFYLPLWTGSLPENWKEVNGRSVGRHLALNVFNFTPDRPGGVAPGYAGELILNFGLIGLVAGMLLLGALHALVFQLLRFSVLSSAELMVAASFIAHSTIVLLNSGFLPAAGNAILQLASFMILVRLQWFSATKDTVPNS
jgi:hypothetical protein